MERNKNYFKQNTMKKTKQIFIAILGIMLVPIFFTVYFLDRAILLPFVWLPIKNIGKWYGDGFEMWLSIFRILTIFLLVVLYLLIRTFF
jgi:hypothetical protein